MSAHGYLCLPRADLVCPLPRREKDAAVVAHNMQVLDMQREIQELNRLHRTATAAAVVEQMNAIDLKERHEALDAAVRLNAAEYRHLPAGHSLRLMLAHARVASTALAVSIRFKWLSAKDAWKDLKGSFILAALVLKVRFGLMAVRLLRKLQKTEVATGQTAAL